jgi:hypothetical protein
MVEEAHKQERRQKEIYAKLDMPHSPVHEPQVFTPLLFRMMGLRKKTLVDVRKMLVSPMKKKALFMEMMMKKRMMWRPPKKSMMISSPFWCLLPKGEKIRLWRPLHLSLSIYSCLAMDM